MTIDKSMLNEAIRYGAFDVEGLITKLKREGYDSSQIENMTIYELAQLDPELAQQSIDSEKLTSMDMFSNLSSQMQELLVDMDKMQEEEATELPDENDYAIPVDNENDEATTDKPAQQTGNKKLTIDDIDKYDDIDKLLNDSFDDEDVLALIAGEDAKLSDEEKAKFKAYIQGDKDKLELDDIKNVLKSIKNGEFDIDDYNNFEIEELEEEEELEKEEPTEAEGAQGAGGADGAGGAGGGYPTGGVDPTDPGDSTTEVKPGDYSNMTLDELKAEKDKEAKNLEGQEAKRDEEQQKLSDIDNGNNEELQALDEKADEAEQAWEDVAKEIDEQLAEELDKANEKVDTAQTEADQADTALFNQQQVVSQATAERDYAQSYKEEKTAEKEAANAEVNTAQSNLETAQANLEAAKSQTDENGNPVDTSALEAAVNECEAQLEAAQAKYEAAQEMETAAQEQLTAKEEALNAAKEQEGILQEAKAQKDEALQTALAEQEQAQQDLIAKIPEDDETGLKEKLEAAKEAYDTAKSDYTSKKQELRTEQKTAIENAQKDVNTTKTNLQKIDNEIKKREVDEKTDEKVKEINKAHGIEDKPSGSELGKGVMDLAKQFIGLTQSQIIQKAKDLGLPKEIYSQFLTNGAWCASFASLMLNAVAGKDNLVDGFNNCDNKNWTQRLASFCKQYAVSANDLQSGDMICFSFGGTGLDHTVLFDSWADDSHQYFYTVERSHNGGKDCVQRVKRPAKDLNSTYGMYHLLKA